MSKRGKPLNSQCRELVLKLQDYFERESQNGGPLLPVTQVKERLAQALGISVKTIYRINKEKFGASGSEDNVFPTPGKKRRQASNGSMPKLNLAMISTHFKCRGGMYPRSTVERFPVPDDKVSWSTEFTGYTPANFTSPVIHGKPWADPEIGNPSFEPNWNTLDGKVNRESYMGAYQIVDKYPLNPIGRTGVVGRGVLGRWGPNHAADPVVTRWKRLEDGKVEIGAIDNKPILQFIAIKRGDTGEWALPGGMVDPGEKVSATAIREFQEEAMNSLAKSEDEKKEWLHKFKKFFAKGDTVYEGYVDDPRNTDNAWMETGAYNFHDENGQITGDLKLHAGDDAVGVRWVDITPNIKLYASHEMIVKKVLNRHIKDLYFYDLS